LRGQDGPSLVCIVGPSASAAGGLSFVAETR